MRRRDVSQCPVCGRRGHGTTVELEDLSGRVEGTFISQACPCGTRYLSNPVDPDHIAAAYGDDYYSFQSPEPTRVTALRDACANGCSRSDTLPAASGIATPCPLGSMLPGYPPRGPAGRVLDIGCGSGERLHRLAIAGWECAGVDASERAAEAARAARARRAGGTCRGIALRGRDIRCNSHVALDRTLCGTPPRRSRSRPSLEARWKSRRYHTQRVIARGVDAGAALGELGRPASLRGPRSRLVVATSP